MRCPHCNSIDDRVIESRQNASGTVIRRRRECSACGYRFTSYENIEEKKLKVVKRDGRREPFDLRKLEVGVRPEFVRFTDEGIPVEIEKIEDLGRYQVVTALHEAEKIKMVVSEDEPIPSDSPKISFDPEFTRIYHNDWFVGGQAS